MTREPLTFEEIIKELIAKGVAPLYKGAPPRFSWWANDGFVRCAKHKGSVSLYGPDGIDNLKSCHDYCGSHDLCNQGDVRCPLSGP